MDLWYFICWNVNNNIIIMMKGKRYRNMLGVRVYFSLYFDWIWLIVIIVMVIFFFG